MATSLWQPIIWCGCSCKSVCVSHWKHGAASGLDSVSMIGCAHKINGPWPSKLILLNLYRKLHCAQKHTFTQFSTFHKHSRIANISYTTNAAQTLMEIYLHKIFTINTTHTCIKHQPTYILHYS